MILGFIGMIVASVVTGTSTFLAAAAASAIPLALFSWLLWWLIAKLIPSWLSVGTDGVLVQKVRKTFIPFSEMKSVQVDGKAPYFQVLFERKSGKPLKVKTATEKQAEVVKLQVESALRSFESRRQAALIEDLEPGERSEADWRESLKGLMNRGGYRSKAVDREQLLRVVEDPGQHPRVRVSAAVALEDGARPEDKKRIRVAAQASASPKIRVALEQAADGDVEDSTLSEVRRVSL